MSYFKIIIEHLFWLFLSIVFSLIFVWINEEILFPYVYSKLFPNSETLFDSFMEGVTGLISFLVMFVKAGMVGFVAFFVFIPIRVYVIKPRVHIKEKEFLWNTLTILGLIVLLVTLYSVIEFVSDKNIFIESYSFDNYQRI